MRQQDTIRKPNPKNTGIFIVKIVMSVIDPRFKYPFQLFGKNKITAFPKPAEIFSNSMRAEPVSRNRYDGIPFNLLHLIRFCMRDNIKRTILIVTVHRPYRRLISVNGSERDQGIMTETFFHNFPRA